jgi:hypothetical protein
MDDLIGGKTGIQTVVAQAHDASALPDGVFAGEQAALFPLSPVESGERARKLGSLQRGPGRPPGAANKSTTAWREFLLSRYPSPLQGLAEIAFRPLMDLAKELNAGQVPQFEKLIETLKLQKECMKELAPYIHSKMPIAIDAGEKGLINLVIHPGGIFHDQSNSHGAINAEFIKMGIEENQEVSADNAQNSNGSFTNGDTQHAETEGENE